MAKKTGKIRSPKYPILGLKTAIERVGSLYQRERTASVPRDIAAKAWGYSMLSGPALQTISTLTQYGLIERASGQKVKISELGLDILIPKAPEDKAKSIQTASRNPVIFRELMSQYPKELPSDDTLKAYLIRRSTPYTEDSAKKLIKALRETLDFINLPESRVEEIAEEQNEDVAGKTAKLFEQQKRPSKPQKSDSVCSIPLPSGKATLTIYGELNLEDITFIKGFLDLYTAEKENNSKK